MIDKLLEDIWIDVAIVKEIYFTKKYIIGLTKLQIISNSFNLLNLFL